MKENIASDLSGLTVPIESIHLDPTNVREGHDLQAIADSLHQYGQRKPIVVNSANDVIEAGNGTYQAAKVILGWQNIAAVFVKDDPQTATGFAIADNRTGDLSSFNFEALDLTLQSFEMPAEIPGIEAGFLEELRLGLAVPNGKDWEEAFGGLPDGEKSPFIQMTFTLHDTQSEEVKRALTIAKGQGKFTGSSNENSNGNALARICETYITGYGQS